MAYFDVDYVTPVGNPGIHYACEADTEEDAAAKTPVMLSYGTPWSPDQFKVTAVRPSTNVPQPTPVVHESENSNIETSG